MKNQKGKVVGTGAQQKIQSDSQSDTQTASRRSLVSGFGVLGVLLLTSSTSFAGSSWTSPNTYSAYEGQGPSGNDSYQQQQASRRQMERRNLATSPFSPESQNVALGVGQIFLMGDTASKFENALGYQLDYTYGVSRIFGFTSSLGFSSHDQEGAQVGVKNSYSQVNLQTGLRANLNSFDQVVPYAKAGLGFYRASQSITPAESVSALMFGIHIGAGLDLHLSNRAFFGADLTLHDVFGSTERATSGLIDLGGSHTSFTAHVGVVL